MPRADLHSWPLHWYRRAWVLTVSAVLIAALSFASGFVAGNATAFRLALRISGIPALSSARVSPSRGRMRG